MKKDNMKCLAPPTRTTAGALLSFIKYLYKYLSQESAAPAISAHSFSQ